MTSADFENHELNLRRLARDLPGLTGEQREQLTAAAGFIREQQLEQKILSYVAADDSADASDWSGRVEAIRSQLIDNPHGSFRQLAERAMQKDRQSEDKTQDMPLNPRPRLRI